MPKTLPRAGRLFLLVLALWVALVAAGALLTLPSSVDLVRRALAFACLASVGALAVYGLIWHRQAMLWRVRRKLILSYVFFGVVPVLLVVAFVLVGGVLVYATLASYVFTTGYDDLVDDVRQSAETIAIELSRDPTGAQQAAERRYSNMAGGFPRLSLAIVRRAGSGPPDRIPLVAAGPWSHGPPPTTVPAWLARGGSFAGTLVTAVETPGERPELVIRALVPTANGTRAIVADLPIDDQIIARLRARTATTVVGFDVLGCGEPIRASGGAVNGGLWSAFREASASLPCTAWEDGAVGQIQFALNAPVSGIYDRIAMPAAGESGATGSWDVFLQVLVLLAGLFLVVQASALVIGVVLARSITSAVHELFTGTERVRDGDFTHRIPIESRDQLGDLAASFNEMSASIEQLLHVQREKQRLDDELRIARDIQKSLLPVHPPQVPGLDIADLCEPAREVGGDYYDFFELGDGRLGVLIADVSGKGTSAALYMAELKGLVMALSHSERSPRDLLIAVNRRLSAHFDGRSFITMTYATIDRAAGRLVCARAGHTPLLIASGDGAEFVVPDGMVLGLRLPGAADRFETVLEEHARPIQAGDVIVFYTDGITEAMDTAGELFGDAALLRVVASQVELSAAGIRERVVREVEAFVGEAEPHDDMTMVVVKVTEVA